MYPGMLIIHRSTSQDVIVSLFIFLNFHQKQNFVTYLTPYVFKKNIDESNNKCHHFTITVGL